MQISLQLARRFQAQPKAMVARPNGLEKAKLDDALSRRHRVIDQRLERRVDQRTDRFSRARSSQGDHRSLVLMRLDQDQETIRSQMASRSLEGMDHALDRDSSKRPAEESDVEWSLPPYSHALG
jgi:hypothetical protein